jgi:3-oxoacyl-[acyl-carrier-protein] synthase-3
MKAYINFVSYYLPEKVLSNVDISIKHPEWDAEKISKKTGIFNRHIASDVEFASDLGIKAALRLFDENQINVNSIDFLLYCTQSPDYFLPTTACIIQDKLGLPTSVGALDFNLGCSGYVYGLSLAKGLIYAGIAKNVLLITSETYSKFIHESDKSNKTIFGDAASASLISSTEIGFELCDFVLGTDGSGYDNLIVKNGGVKNIQRNGNDIYDENNLFIKNDDYLYMNGNAIFSFTSNSIPILINDLFIKNNLKSENIHYFLMHQANKFMLDFIRKKINIPEEKFIYYLEDVGNTVSNTIPIALKENWSNFNKKTILLAGFGVGYSWGGCLIKSIQ